VLDSLAPERPRPSGHSRPTAPATEHLPIRRPLAAMLVEPTSGAAGDVQVIEGQRRGPAGGPNMCFGYLRRLERAIGRRSGLGEGEEVVPARGHRKEACREVSGWRAGAGGGVVDVD